MRNELSRFLAVLKSHDSYALPAIPERVGGRRITFGLTFSPTLFSIDHALFHPGIYYRFRGQPVIIDILSVPRSLEFADTSIQN